MPSFHTMRENRPENVHLMVHILKNLDLTAMIVNLIFQIKNVHQEFYQMMNLVMNLFLMNLLVMKLLIMNLLEMKLLIMNLLITNLFIMNVKNLMKKIVMLIMQMLK